MSTKGIKRATPGAETEKKDPFGDVEISDQDAQKLQDVQKVIARAELALERRAQEKIVPVYEKRREVVKGIPKFWPVALMNRNEFAMLVQFPHDQNALSYLEDLWLIRDQAENRAFTLEFYFKENPYFSNTVLKKEYKYIPPPAAADDTPDEDGVTESMIDFSWERDIEIQSCKIDWKDDSKNLTKLYPRDGDDSEVGSFFLYFEQPDDPYDLGVMIANDIFPEAIDYFLGHMPGIDSDSEDEEEEEEEEEEIDLEKPRPKKQKKA